MRDMFWEKPRVGFRCAEIAGWRVGDGVGFGVDREAGATVGIEGEAADSSRFGLFSTHHFNLHSSKYLIGAVLSVQKETSVTMGTGNCILKTIFVVTTNQSRAALSDAGGLARAQPNNCTLLVEWLGRASPSSPPGRNRGNRKYGGFIP